LKRIIVALPHGTTFVYKEKITFPTGAVDT